MSTPVSLKERSFFALPSPKYSSLIKDDFVQKKFKTVGFKLTSKNGSTVAYKNTVDYKFDEKTQTDKFALKDELKFGFAYRALYSQFRIDRSGNMRVHLDLGNYNIANTQQNVFMQYKLTNTLDKVWLRLGTNYYSDHVQSHQRLERNFDGNFQLSYKNVCRFNSFVFGVATIFGLNTHKVTKYDAVFQYTHNKFEFGLQHTTPRNDKVEGQALADNQPGRLTAGLNYKHNDNTTLAVQARRIFSKDKPVTVNVGVNHVLCKDASVKVKVNQDLKVTSTLKYKIDQTVSAIATVQLPLKREGGVLHSNAMIPLPVGIQIDFNI